MRHEQLQRRETFDLVDVAAVWPSGSGPSAPLAEIEAFARTPAASVPDMPAEAGSALAAVYAGLMGAFVLTMATGGQASFAIAISAFYVAMFIGVPAVFLKTERSGGGNPSLSRFLADGMQTATGHISGTGALVQMLIVPALLTLAVLAIGIAALVML